MGRDVFCKAIDAQLDEARLADVLPLREPADRRLYLGAEPERNRGLGAFGSGWHLRNALCIAERNTHGKEKLSERNTKCTLTQQERAFYYAKASTGKAFKLPTFCADDSSP